MAPRTSKGKPTGAPTSCLAPVYGAGQGRAGPLTPQTLKRRQARQQLKTLAIRRAQLRRAGKIFVVGEHGRCMLRRAAITRSGPEALRLLDLEGVAMMKELVYRALLAMKARKQRTLVAKDATFAMEQMNLQMVARAPKKRRIPGATQRGRKLAQMRAEALRANKEGADSASSGE
jgi:hypothetical protein